MKMMKKVIALFLALCLIPMSAAFAANEGNVAADRITFLLMCNEGMTNDGGNVGNTMMVVSLDPELGNIRLLMFTWDTFIQYAGYDLPQLIDQPYRQNGPEETMRVFNANFGQSIDRFLSINYLNLASLVDSYGGVEVDLTRAERNALNAMISSKKDALQSMSNLGLVGEILMESLAQKYYLEEWGEGTHLNGMQAVGFGWLQYDSVYNCCLREVKVITNLFNSVGTTISNQVAFYTEATGIPAERDVRGRRLINLDDLTEDDREFLYRMVSPIFEMSYNNLDKDAIIGVSIALAKAAYLAARQGVNVFSQVEYQVLPLEARNDYDVVAGRKGHLIDYDANAAAITEFLNAE